LIPQQDGWVEGEAEKVRHKLSCIYPKQLAKQKAKHHPICDNRVILDQRYFVPTAHGFNGGTVGGSSGGSVGGFCLVLSGSIIVLIAHFFRVK
jgi:hypothetical protein